MKKIIPTVLLLVFLATPSISSAFTRADIDLLVSLDLIENKSLIPLLYLLAEDTPAPSEEKEEEEYEDDKEKEKKEEDDNKAETHKTPSNIVTNAYIDKAKFAGDQEKGIFEIELSLSAKGGDAWISDNLDSSGSTGFIYQIIGDGTFSGTETAFLSDTSSKVKKDGRYKIKEGETESFEITVELDPGTISEGKIWGVQLLKVAVSDNHNGSGKYTYWLSDREYLKTKRIVID